MIHTFSPLIQFSQSKFLDGYTVDINCHPESNIDLMVESILSDLSVDASLAEQHGRFVRLSLPNLSSKTGGIGNAFSCLQKMLSRTLQEDGWQVENYSLSQSSLEQVFLQLTTNENEKVSTPANDALDEESLVSC